MAKGNLAGVLSSREKSVLAKFRNFPCKFADFSKTTDLTYKSPMPYRMKGYRIPNLVCNRYENVTIDFQGNCILLKLNSLLV